MKYEVESNGSGVYVYRLTREQVAWFTTIDDAQLYMSAARQAEDKPSDPIAAE